MSHLIKYFTAFLLDWLRTTLIATALTLGGLSGGAYAANYSTIHYGANPSYDSIPITPKTWKEVDLSYFSVINGKRYQNSIDLLRPITWLHQHGMDKVGNTITLSLLKFGINRVKAYVVAIKLTKVDTRGVNWSKRGFRPVIGTFKRYALDVRTYTFRDSKGHIDHIHATPNHPFYVQNKHGFVAIEDVKDTDVLVGIENGAGLSGNKHNGTGSYYDEGNGNGNRDVNAEGHGRLNNNENGHDRLDDVVHLVCAKGIHNHCGKPYSDGKHPIAVYNLEVYRKHVFRVESEGVVVHNFCKWRQQLGTKNLDELSNSQVGDIVNKFVNSRLKFSSSHELYLHGESEDFFKIHAIIKEIRKQVKGLNFYEESSLYGRYGNCHEFSCLATKFMRDNGFTRRIDILRLEGGDHVFVRIDGGTDSAYIIDSWANRYYPQSLMKRIDTMPFEPNKNAYPTIVIPFHRIVKDSLVTIS